MRPGQVAPQIGTSPTRNPPGTCPKTAPNPALAVFVWEAGEKVGLGQFRNQSTGHAPDAHGEESFVHFLVGRLLGISRALLSLLKDSTMLNWGAQFCHCPSPWIESSNCPRQVVVKTKTPQRASLLKHQRQGGPTLLVLAGAQ